MSDWYPYCHLVWGALAILNPPKSSDAESGFDFVIKKPVKLGDTAIVPMAADAGGTQVLEGSYEGAVGRTNRIDFIGVEANPLIVMMSVGMAGWHKEPQRRTPLEEKTQRFYRQFVREVSQLFKEYGLNQFVSTQWYSLNKGWSSSSGERYEGRLSEPAIREGLEKLLKFLASPQVKPLREELLSRINPMMLSFQRTLWIEGLSGRMEAESLKALYIYLVNREVDSEKRDSQLRQWVGGAYLKKRSQQMGLTIKEVGEQAMAIPQETKGLASELLTRTIWMDYLAGEDETEYAVRELMKGLDDFYDSVRLNAVNGMILQLTQHPEWIETVVEQLNGELNPNKRVGLRVAIQGWVVKTQSGKEWLQQVIHQDPENELVSELRFQTIMHEDVPEWMDVHIGFSLLVGQLKTSDVSQEVDDLMQEMVGSSGIQTQL